MKLDNSKTIPYGKYQGKTVGWLLSTDKRYCEWLTKEDLWKKWNLYQTASGSVKKKDPKSSVSGTGPIKGTINYDPKDPPPWNVPEQVQQATEPLVRDNGEVLVSIKEKPVPPKDNRWIEEAKILLELIYKQKETTPQIKQQIEELLYLPVEN